MPILQEISFDNFIIVHKTDDPELLKHIQFYNEILTKNKNRIEQIICDYANLNVSNSEVYSYYNFIDAHKSSLLLTEYKKIVKSQRRMYENLCDHISKTSVNTANASESQRSVSVHSNNSGSSNNIQSVSRKSIDVKSIRSTNESIHSVRSIIPTSRNRYIRNKHNSTITNSIIGRFKK